MNEEEWFEHQIEDLERWEAEQADMEWEVFKAQQFESNNLTIKKHENTTSSN